MTRHLVLALLVAGGVLAACGPVSREAAERQCLAQAQDAASPRGTVAVGATNSGPAARFELDLSTDFINGRDPSAVYDQCVYRKSGQPPSRPLYSRPDWKR